MKVTTYILKHGRDTLELVECPWCGQFESHFVHLVNEPLYETVICQNCVKQIAETILKDDAQIRSRA